MYILMVLTYYTVMSRLKDQFIDRESGHHNRSLLTV